MAIFSERKIGLQLLALHKRKKTLPTVSFLEANGTLHEGWRLVWKEFRVTYRCRSVLVSRASWKRRGTITRPCRMIVTKQVLKISFLARRGGECQRFVWLRDNVGIAIDEVAVERLITD